MLTHRRRLPNSSDKLCSHPTLLAHAGEYGVVSALSRTLGVSRPTLYAWRAQTQEALQQAFAPPPRVHARATRARAPHLNPVGCGPCQHARHPNLSGDPHGPGHQPRDYPYRAPRRRNARPRLEATHVPTTTRALALDEIYTHDCYGAYRNVVDVHSGAVWASEGPLPVDGDSWTLVLWDLQDRRLRWDRVVLGGGGAMQVACRTVTPQLALQHDQWHVFHRCAQLHGRLTRQQSVPAARTPVVAR